MSTGRPSPFAAQHASSQDRFDDAKKIDVRPRAGGAVKAEGTEAGEAVLSFSCPSCLEMLSAAKSATPSPVQCPQCSAVVMPPTLVTVATAPAAGGKTLLPPPRKTGTQALRQ